jgi:3-oxoadipate enol-lactonase
MAGVYTKLGTIGVARSGAAGVPILFLHGVGSDKSVWRPQLDHFGRTRSAVAIDYPGYGESAFVPDATRDDFADAAFAALDAMEIGEAHICGLSLGGVVALAMAARRPDRCRSLILADSFAVHPDGQAIYDRSVAASRAMSMRALAEARAPSLLGKGADDSIKTEVIDTMSGIDAEAYRLGAAAVWLADQRDRAAAVRAPTLVLVGDEDRITPPALSEELAALIPGARLTVIAGAGHLANIEQPDAFNAAVHGFLAGVEGPPA